MATDNNDFFSTGLSKNTNSTQSNPNDPFGGDVAGESGNPPAASMTGARGDNSVLFSLTNLQALALGSKDSKPVAKAQTKIEPEGSGLIDIRTMSSALQFSKQNNTAKKSDEVGFAGDSSTAFLPTAMSSNVILPNTERKSGSGVIVAGIIGGSVLLLGGLVAILFAAGVFNKQPVVVPQQQVAANPEASKTTTPENTQLALNTPPANTTAQPETPAVSPEKDPGKTAVAPAGKTPTGKTPTNTAGKTAAAAAVAPTPTATPTATPTPAVEPAPTKPATKHSDELDELLGGGTKSSGGDTTAASGGPEKLSQSQISKTMGGANFGSCKAIGTGKVSVSVTISSSGAVTGVNGDGSPLGSCVAGVIKRLKFPSISSPSQTFTYPVFVRD